MTTALTLTTGPATLTAAGEIDMSNAETFAAALADAVRAAGETTLLVDLTAVEYLDSAGLAALFEHAARIEVRTSAMLEPLMSLSGLAELTTIHSQ